MVYGPKFPNCVDGNSYRHPLKTPAFEAVSLEMDHIYSTVKLSHVERAHLLELHKHLVQVEYAEKYSVSPSGNYGLSNLTLKNVQDEFAAFCRRNDLPVVDQGHPDDI